MSLQAIRNFDYTILLCRKMAETRAFYREVMGFLPGPRLSNLLSAYRLRPSTRAMRSWLRMA